MKNEFNLSLHREQMEVAMQFFPYVMSGGAYDIKRLKARAGTGKTYTIGNCIRIANSITDSRGGKKIAVVAFTGRAAGQLNLHGLDATTIHTLLYSPVLDSKGNVTRWKKNDIRDIRDAYYAIVVDEGSMLPGEILNDLRAIGLPLYIMGDDFQLPSVSPDSFNIMDESDASLSLLTKDDSTLLTNRRTDPAFSGIYDIMNSLIDTGNIPRFCKNPGVSFTRGSKVFSGEIFQDNDFDIVLCGTNSVRRRINNKIRSMNGHNDVRPDVGEKIICLRNTVISGKKIHNGDIATVTGRIDGDGMAKYFLDNPNVVVTLMDESLITEKQPENMTEGVAHFTYGNAISVHKAQGSTFNNVLFLDEDVSYFLDRRKFRYTAVSRAAKNLVIAR